MITTTSRVYFRLTNEYSQDRIWSFGYMSDDITEAQLRTIANSFITNNQAFKDGYRPTAIVTIWRETVAKEILVE